MTDSNPKKRPSDTEETPAEKKQAVRAGSDVEGLRKWVRELATALGQLKKKACRDSDAGDPVRVPKLPAMPAPVDPRDVYGLLEEDLCNEKEGQKDLPCRTLIKLVLDTGNQGTYRFFEQVLLRVLCVCGNSGFYDEDEFMAYVILWERAFPSASANLYALPVQRVVASFFSCWYMTSYLKTGGTEIGPRRQQAACVLYWGMVIAPLGGEDVRGSRARLGCTLRAELVLPGSTLPLDANTVNLEELRFNGAFADLCMTYTGN